MTTLALFRHFVRLQPTKTATIRNRKTSRILKRQQQRCLATIRIVKPLENGVSVQFTSNEEHKFNNVWLRDHCQCSQCYFKDTNQRNYETNKIPLDVKPKDMKVAGDEVILTWPDDHVSRFKASWLHKHQYGQTYEAFTLLADQRKFWGKEHADGKVQSVPFDELQSNEESLYELLRNIAIYGHGFVSQTPLDIEKGVTAIGKRIGQLRPSQYGTTWDIISEKISEKIEHLDTSYLDVPLAGHTDGTYFTEAPGLQFFHIPSHKGGEGGESLIVDGIACALKLQQENKTAFDFLANNPVPGVYFDGINESWMRSYLPLIRVDSTSKQIYQVRFNDFDRDILSTFNYDDVQTFYESLNSFSKILGHEDNKVWMKLQPGKVLLVDNWRVLHGRRGFTGRRQLQGTYINRDEYLSKLRILHMKYGK